MTMRGECLRQTMTATIMLMAAAKKVMMTMIMGE
jgi:hypothetical protein